MTDSVNMRRKETSRSQKKNNSMSSRAISMVIPQHMRLNSNEIPPASSIPLGTSKRGYLWRLSGRKMLSKSDWKRKYFVLSQEQGKLYFYDNELGQGGRQGERARGCGVIELKFFMDCVEAPLTDHKKATNVFLLLAAERGFFDQGRCYLSAETLIEMKDWVARIKTVLQGIHRIKEDKAQPKSPMDLERIPRSETQVLEPVYSSIKEESIHRSNSMSTLPSLYATRDQDLGRSGRDNRGAKDWLNRSMETEGPVCGLGGVDHNLTYNYSSSEESLNESFSINFTQRTPRSAETSLRRPLKQKPEITLRTSGVYDSFKRPVKSGGLAGGLGEFRHSSPNKSQPSNEYLAKMYSEMARVDEQLVMAQSCTETDGGSVAETITPIYSGSDLSLQQMESKLKQVVNQSEELYRVFRQLESETSSTRLNVGSIQEALKSNSQNTSNLEDRLMRYQATIQGMERQAIDLMGEIRATHNKVVQSLEEADRSRREFVNLKEKAETILLQLQGEVSKQNIHSPPSALSPKQLSQFSNSSGPSSFPSASRFSGESGIMTWSPGLKQKPGGGQKDLNQTTPGQPVYAQPIKKADREKRVVQETSQGYTKPNYSESSPQARRELRFERSGGRQGMEASMKDTRPRSLMVVKKEYKGDQA